MFTGKMKLCVSHWELHIDRLPLFHCSIAIIALEMHVAMARENVLHTHMDHWLVITFQSMTRKYIHTDRQTLSEIRNRVTFLHAKVHAQQL